ncbi:MAG: DmsE family decaheme c-type cytochrome [Nitrospinae bacterium]|nr:DmsE family decaheme c-type cytochrome [Nitrospinota bacterium]
MAEANVGWKKCLDCHQDWFDKWKETRMGKLFLKAPQNETQKLVCEACHGPGEEHIANVSAGEELDLSKLITFKKHSTQTVDEKNGQCLQCHQNDAYTAMWKGSTHQGNKVACVDCHTIMQNNTDRKNMAKKTQADTCFQCHLQRKAQYQKSAHMPYREGKVTCTDCHNPHGTPNPKLIAADSVNEACYKCHMEKRGPFLWEHAPVRESCLNCHEPHGSNHDKLLIAKRPQLCQRCHAPTGHPANAYTDPGQAVAGNARQGQFMANRACNNCHSQIHGSNHPAGHRFHR